MRQALGEVISQMHRGNALSELCNQLDAAVVNEL